MRSGRCGPGSPWCRPLATLNRRLQQEKGVRLAVRVGIHTGLVVVGEVGGGSRQEQLALGETPNLAARLQGLAAPDTVVVSPATFRLVRGYFTAQELGAHRLKGVTAPVQVYRMLEASAAQSRLDIAGPSGFTPLVGRESEVLLLLERWAHSQDGRGQVVLLSGEAGIGKSRLVEVLRQRVISQGATRLVFRCSPYHQQSALYPVIDHLQRFLHWDSTEAPEAKIEALEQALRTSRLPLDEVTPLFAALLSLPHPAQYPLLNLTPQRQRQKTHDALVAWLLEETERQPVLAVWEDLHWADPSTLELLGLVLDQVPTARMLTLLTCRPEFLPPWASRSHLTQVTLTRLGRPQVEAMITSLTGGKALPAAVVEHVVAKTDGVPLFVEELVKMILESGLVREEGDHYELTGPLPPLAIPSTLHDSLMARLDRLATVKEVAQLGATLGRTFAYELLQAVSPLDEATLQHGLRQLVEAELVYQRGVPPQATYLFKHALIQEAAYQSLLRSTRQQYHQRIAQALEARFPGARGDAAGAGGPALHRRGPNRSGHSLLAAGGSTRQRPLGPSGSRQPLHHRDRAAPDPARDAGAYPARLDSAPRPRRGSAGGERAGSARGGAHLHPGSRAVSAGRRDARACPGAVWAVAVLSCTGTVSTRRESWGKRCCAWRNMPTTPRFLSLPTMPLG